MLKTRPRYRSLGRGQPPQRLVRARLAVAYCNCCGHGVSRYALQRPMCIDCWRSEYESSPIRDYRDIPMQFCHRHGEGAQVSFGAPQCLTHD